MCCIQDSKIRRQVKGMFDKRGWITAYKVVRVDRSRKSVRHNPPFVSGAKNYRLGKNRVSKRDQGKRYSHKAPHGFHVYLSPKEAQSSVPEWMSPGKVRIVRVRVHIDDLLAAGYGAAFSWEQICEVFKERQAVFKAMTVPSWDDTVPVRPRKQRVA